MSYIVNLPDGQLLTTILDGTVDTTASSLTLVGRNYSGYGEIIAEDLVALLVNFSNNVSPANPNTGQIWYDNSNKLVKVYTGSAWKNIGSATYASIAPNTTVGGDLWWHSVNKQLFCYDGTNPYNVQGWTLVGPGYSSDTGYGKSGALFEEISDGVVLHHVVSMYIDGERYAIISEDQFTPNVAITGFSSQLQVGWNMNSTTTKGTIWGTANNASYLGTQPAANYFRNNINNSGTGTLTILNNGGLTLGTYGQFTATVSGNNVSLQNTVNGSLNLVNQGNVALTVTPAGEITVNTDPALALGVATKQYVDNKFYDTVLYGVPVAPTAPAGTSNTMLATTEFVTSGLAGIFPYKIYKDSSWMWMDTAGANLVVSGTTVMTATSSGVVLNNGATATTQSQTYTSTGDSKVATTEYTKTATTWWGGSAKFVSNVAPVAGVNDIGSHDGDFWFQYAN